VFLGLLALVVDIGIVSGEAEELRSGADSAAMAVAVDCARWRDADECRTGSSAREYANDNANTDNVSGATACGRGPAGAPSFGRPQACGGSAPANCASGPPASGPYIQVVTTTDGPSGTVLPPVFAQAIGGTGWSGATCARATWAPPTHMPVFGLAISRSTWQQLTSSGTNYMRHPHYPDVTDEDRICLYGSPSAGSCPASPGSPPNPNFVWLDSTGGSCATTGDVAVGNTVNVNNGDDPGGTCAGRLDSFTHPVTNHDDPTNSNVTLYVAVYDNYSPSGGGRVRVVGFGGFISSGYFLKKGGTTYSHRSFLSGSSGCSAANASCLYGYFERVVVPKNHPIDFGQTDYGVNVVRLIS